MNAKYIVVATLLGGLIIFGWGAFTHTVLPWGHTLDEFADDEAAVNAMRAHAPENGMYLSPKGVFVAVSLRDDLADKTMTRPMVIEVVSNFLLAFLLAALMAQLHGKGATRRAAKLGIIALAAALSIHVSNWAWYGFSVEHTILEFVDVAGGWFLAGLVMAVLHGSIVQRKLERGDA